jgi:beta-glucanase (GH16 family)
VIIIVAALVTVVLAGAAVIFVPRWLSTAGSGQQAATGKSSSPAPASPALAPKPTSSPTPTAPPRVVAPSFVPGGWVLKFDDEFGGAGLDTSKWSTGWYGSGVTAPVSEQEDDCYVPSQVSQGGGVLSLALDARAVQCGGGQERYAAGLVSTAGKFTFTYGLVEARVWVPAVTGRPKKVANWPAVWADGKTWPADGEIDIAEGLGGRMCGHLHSAVSPGGVGAGGGSGCPAGIYAGGWHTFAVDWEPAGLTFYYDGRDVGKVTSGVTSAPMFLILDYATGSSGGPVQVPATMKVDYVRVWQHP